eukprot:282160-Chlamydomonas_euryale.AAC.6
MLRALSTGTRKPCTQNRGVRQIPSFMKPWDVQGIPVGCSEILWYRYKYIMELSRKIECIWYHPRPHAVPSGPCVR